MNFDKEISILVKVATSEIDFLNKILEGYEGTALVTTENPQEGLVRLYTALSMKTMLLELLQKLPREVKVIDITE
ncbi:MAG: hypothetical protein APF76_08145 [Desulfitibacter sp. BRH_c19]|nr:MAG: hypothetical protein APF76_08145 [Desulfitibacter sp. BRH_c19]